MFYKNGCVTNSLNGELTGQSCNDLLGRTYSSNHLGEGGGFSWHVNGELSSYSDGLSWQMKDNVVSGFEFNDFSKQRKVDFEENQIIEDNLDVQMDVHDILINSNIGSTRVAIEYENAKQSLETISTSGIDILKTASVYSQNNEVESFNDHYKKAYLYDQFDRVTNEKLTTKNELVDLSYGYIDNQLSEIYPYIKNIDYHASGAVKQVRYSNDLVLDIKIDSFNANITKLSYGNLLLISNRYNLLGQLTKASFLKAPFARALNQKYIYENYKLNSNTQSNHNERDARGDLVSIRNERLNHCGEFLCEVDSNSNYKFIYHPQKGLVGAVKDTHLKNFNPQLKGSFLVISDSEILIEGNLVKIVKVGELPLGVLHNKSFYPVIINHKKEVIGLISEDGKKILYLRKYSTWGDKNLIINPSLSADEQLMVKTLDKDIVWGFGRLISNPFSEKAKLYWSKSRTYSVDAKAWTSMDPLVAWNAKSLITTNGNWNPLMYCSDDPVNMIDPSGYLSFSVNYSRRSNLNKDMLTAGTKTLTSFAIGALYNNAARRTFGLGVGLGELAKNSFRVAALGTVAGSIGATALNMGGKSFLVGSSFSIGQMIGNSIGAGIDTFVDNSQGSSFDFFTELANSTGLTGMLDDIGFGSGEPNHGLETSGTNDSSSENTSSIRPFPMNR